MSKRQSLRGSAASSGLRLQTIVRLRWMAIVGQLLTTIATYVILGFDVPIGIAMTIIVLSVWLNIFLTLRFPARTRLPAPTATLLLSYDVLQLAALLYVTGGIQNPFSFLIIVPATVSAATLPVNSTFLVGALTFVLAGLLTYFHWPLPWYPGRVFEMPLLYNVGILASIYCGLIFISLYARRLAREARQMSDALAATELVLAREQKLHALDGLAAAAAHELGTPLATITLVAKELELGLDKGSPIAEDIALLRSQTKRCREILNSLTNRSTERDPLHAYLPLTHLIDEAVEPYRVFEKEVVVEAGPAADVLGDAAEEPVAERNPGVVYGLTNIVENAVDFATARVLIRAEWSADKVTVTVVDDGPGFPPNVLDTLGEPYITTRLGGVWRRRQKRGSGGMGLGFFIAKTLLERSGATIELANQEPPNSGASVGITWVRRIFEAGGENAVAGDEIEVELAS